MNPSVAQWLGALEWVMTQPGLLHGLPGGTDPIFRADDPRLLAMLAGARRDPTRLLELLSAPRSHKVGIAFEALVHFGIEQGLGHTVLGRDVQIRAERRTVGALDVVLRTHTGVEEHWELAYKLFLQCKPDLGWSSWLGPGERDRLDTKVNRMRHHQIPLSARDVASVFSLGPTGDPRDRCPHRLSGPMGASDRDGPCVGCGARLPLGSAAQTAVVWALGGTGRGGDVGRRRSFAVDRRTPAPSPAVERVEWAIDRGRAAVVCCSGTLGQPRTLIRPMRLQRTAGRAPGSMPPGR